jgi:putative aminopeptidase FrvX
MVFREVTDPEELKAAAQVPWFYGVKVEHAVSICAKDSGGPYDLGSRRRLVALAQEHAIPYRLDICPYYGSDAEASVRAGGDHRIGLLVPAWTPRTPSSAPTATRWRRLPGCCWRTC